MIKFWGAMLAFAALAGCRSAQPVETVHVWAGDLPRYEEVAKAYNARVDPLTRLSAAVVLRLDYRDEEGELRREQVEGRCDFVRPRQVLLRLDKKSQTIALLGSDPERFWWIELADRKRALVGEHDKVGADRLAAAGVPVHPLDLIELLGITSLPIEPGAGRVAKSPDGKVLVVTVPGRFGSRRLMLPGEDYRPSRIELVGPDGKVAAHADLSKYVVVSIRGAGPEVVRPYVATDAIIVAADGATRGHLELSAPKIDPSLPKPAAFDLSYWLKHKGVEEVVQLGGPAPAPQPVRSNGESR